VIETGLKGGSLHTVQFAKEQKRIIACVKHPAGWQDADKAKGNAKLIEDGIALPLSTADDLRKLLELVAFRSRQPIMDTEEQYERTGPRQLKML